MLKKTIVFATFVGLAFTLNSPAPAYASGHYKYLRKDLCQYHSHTGTGRSVSKKTARWAARQKWRYVVLRDNHNNREGSQVYSRWTYAVEKSSSCKRKWRVYKCKVKAFPCKSRVKVYRTTLKRITTNNFIYYCKRRYGKYKIKTAAGVGVKNGRKSADWACVFNSGDRKPISILNACRSTFGSNVVSARTRNSNPYFWKCRVRRLVNLG